MKEKAAADAKIPMRDSALAPGTGREKIMLSLGSNVGRRPENLRCALRFLEEDPEIRIIRTSSLYITSPVSYTKQRDFYNGVVELRTRLAPRALLERLRAVEVRMGKNTPFRDGPRRIDIDIVFYGNRVISEPDLVVPHPRCQERRFVLVPLAEIAPRVLHPVLGRTAARLLAGCGEGGGSQRVRIAPRGETSSR